MEALTLLKSSETKTLQLSISKFPKKMHVQNKILKIFEYETCYSDNFKTLILFVFFKYETCYSDNFTTLILFVFLKEIAK